MNKVDFFFLGSLTALAVVLAMLVTFHYQRPVRAIYVPQKVNCNDIIRYEDGSLVCEIHIDAEDSAMPVSEV